MSSTTLIPDARLLTVRQAARLIPSRRSGRRHVDERQVRRWIHDGTLTRHRDAGQLVVDRAEVDQLVAARKRGAAVRRKRRDRRFGRTLAAEALRNLLSSARRPSCGGSS